MLPIPLFIRLLSSTVPNKLSLTHTNSVDFDKFDDKVTTNNEAVTPVGAAMLRQHVFFK